MVLRRRQLLKSLLGIFGLLLLSLAIYAVLFNGFRHFPLETLIAVAIFAIVGIAIFLYIGELVIIGWIVDFLSEIGMPKIEAMPIPLEHEQVGEIIVVKLRSNVATVRECLSVQKQLKLLVDEHHCNFILDFSNAEKTSMSFRGVLLNLRKAARRQAAILGKPFRPVASPPGALFRVFDNREQAVKEMSKHDGYGWVVLCSVPAGIRAVSDLI